MLYGMSVGSMQHKLSMSYLQAKKIMDDYLTSFPGITPFRLACMFACRDFGYVTYWSGRRWYEEEENYYYRGLNASVQGGCADLLSVAAIRCGQWLKAQPWQGSIVSYIHDELLFEIETPYIETAADVLGDLMTVPDLLGLPLKTECKVGSTYGNLEPMQKIEGKWRLVDKKDVF
jgi:DNA polymerase I-like protein with 3'-5' exonuclease and polymerase domains